MDLLPKPTTIKEVYTLLKTRCKCSQCHEQLFGKVYSTTPDKHNTLLCELCTENKEFELSDKEAMANFGIYLWSLNEKYYVFVSQATRILCLDPEFTNDNIMDEGWKSGRMDELSSTLATFVNWDKIYKNK